MIYDRNLTTSLIEIFGSNCTDWSKAKIRNELEDEVYNIHEKMINEKNIKLRNIIFDVYHSIKSIDNTFTEYYINELDNSKKN